MRLEEWGAKVSFHIVTRWDQDAVDLLATKITPDGKRFIAKLVWEERPAGSSYDEDQHVMFRQDGAAIRDGAASPLVALAVELDKAGIMSTGHAQEMKALRGWLEDMRAIAFDKPTPKKDAA